MPIKEKNSWLPFPTVGFITGALLALLATNQFTFLSIFPTSGKILSYSHTHTLFFFWIGFYALMFLLAHPNAQSLKRLIFITLIPSLLASLPYCWGGYNTASQFFLMIFSAYALNAFHINYQTNGRTCSYQTLFYAVWDTLIKLLIALFFTLLCWFILYLGASLFDFINIKFFSILISKAWFISWVTALLVSIGLYIATQTENVVRNIRMILLLMCRYLFIPLAIISILFVGSLLIVTSQQHIQFDSQYLFSSIAFLCVLFLNGIYQDGYVEKPYPIFLLWICRFFIFITPIFTSIALYVFYFHSGNNSISENGFNTDNFPYLLNLSLLFIYNMTYALIAMCRQKQWFKQIERANIVLAIFLITVTLITTYPLFIKQFHQRHYHPHIIKPVIQENTVPHNQTN